MNAASGHHARPRRGYARLGAAAATLMAALTLGACGRVGPPVAPALREPVPPGDLVATSLDGAVEIAWTNPERRMDGSPLRDLAILHVFRAEDAGTGEPRAALRAGRQVAGYAEVAAVRLGDAAPAVVDRGRVSLADRQSLTYGRRYTYVVLAEDVHGRLSRPSPRVSLVHLVPPAAPALRAVPGEGEVRLTWDPPARLVDGSPASGRFTYEVVRSREPGASDPGAAPETVTARPVAETTLVDRGVQNDRTYHYAVRAFRHEAESLARGLLSERLAVMPVDMTPPAPPRGLVAIPTGDGVRLSWQASPDADVARYIVYRTDAGGVTTRVGSAVAPASGFMDRPVRPGTWRYTVTAQDAGSRANESGPSDAATAVVP